MLGVPSDWSPPHLEREQTPASGLLSNQSARNRLPANCIALFRARASMATRWASSSSGWAPCVPRQAALLAFLLLLLASPSPIVTAARQLTAAATGIETGISYYTIERFPPADAFTCVSSMLHALHGSPLCGQARQRPQIRLLLRFKIYRVCDTQTLKANEAPRYDFVCSIEVSSYIN